MLKQAKDNLKKKVKEQEVWKRVSTWTNIHAQVARYAGHGFNSDRTGYECTAMGRYTEVRQPWWGQARSLATSCLCS